MYVGPVPEGRHMFVFQARICCFRHCIHHCHHLHSLGKTVLLGAVCVAMSQYSFRPIRQIRTRSLRRIWSASLWFSSLAHTDRQVNRSHWINKHFELALLFSFPEFIRVGYYVNIDYTEPELRETPPSPPLWEKLQRNILATNPRYFYRFKFVSD